MPVLRAPTEIIIHCSATKNGQWTTVEDIDAWHASRGFNRDVGLIGANQPHLRHIGYHYIIYNNGAVVIGRGEREIGAHCAGHNAQSLGICLVGTDQYSIAQWASLSALVLGLQARIDTLRRVLGHRDTSPDVNGDGKVDKHEYLKTCPGFAVARWLARGMLAAPENIYTPPTESIA